MKAILIFTLYSISQISFLNGQDLDSIHFVEQIVVDGETLILQKIPEVEIMDHGKFMSSDEKRQFYKLKRNLLKVYPYAMYAVNLYNEIQDETDDLKRRKKRKFIKEREKYVREQFEEDVRHFTKSQGHLFVDLINRETGGNCYDVIKEVKSGFVAFNWQRIGLLFGYDLKKTYNPTDPKNADLEMMLSMIKNEKPGYITKVLH